MPRADAGGIAAAQAARLRDPSSSRAPCFFGVALVATASASGKAALLTTGLLLGVVGLLAIIRFAPARATDSMFFLLVGLVGVPVDAFLRYQDHVGGWPGFRIAVSDLGLYLLIGAALLGRLLRRVESPIPARVGTIALLLVLWYGLSASMAERRDLSLFEIASTLHAFAIAWIIAALFRRDHLAWVLALIALQVSVHSGFAIAQGVTGRPIGAGWLGGFTALLTEVLEGGEGRLRPAGLMPHPIVYATALVVWLPLLAAGLGACRNALTRLFCGGGLALGGRPLLTLARRLIASVLAFAALGALALRSRLSTRAAFATSSSSSPWQPSRRSIRAARLCTTHAQRVEQRRCAFRSESPGSA